LTLSLTSADILVPAPGLRRYVEGDSLDFAAPFAWTVDDVLTPEECQAMIARIEAEGPEAAPISTAAGFVMNTNVRNNGRVMFDDADLAQRVFERIRSLLPQQMNAGMTPCGANERWRCYRYEPGQYFAPHYDGCFRRDDFEESLLTLIVYLNDSCKGGDTAFPELDAVVHPKPGRALFFQHRLLHESTPVTAGRKYAARTDVMYRRAA
jgi:predicted 2-oxoglutarate/Fe(II)-dependent dioxygenase YbiX